MTEGTRVPTLYLAEHSGTVGMARAAVELGREAILACDARFTALLELMGVGVMGIKWPEKTQNMVGLRKVGENVSYKISNFLGLYERALSGMDAVMGMKRILADNKDLLLFPTGVTNPEAPWAPGAVCLVGSLLRKGPDVNLSFVKTGYWGYEVIPGGLLSRFREEFNLGPGGNDKSLGENLGKMFREKLVSNREIVLKSG